MITKITGEQPFQVLTNNFSISPSNEGYTLQISADGKQYSNLFSVGAGVTRLVTDVAANSYYRLLGNQSEVSVNWIKVCVTEGGSGGSGTTYTAGDYIDLTGDVISVTGITPDEYLTSADTANFALSADVATLSAATADFVNSGDVKTIIGNYTYLNPDFEHGVLRFFRYYQNGSSAQNVLGNPSINGEKIIDSSMGKNFVLPTSADVQTMINTKAADYTPTSGFSTINGSAITDGSAIVIQGGGADMSEYWTSAETKTYVDSAATLVYDSATTHIEDVELVMSSALNEFHTQIMELSGSTVQSDSIDTIWKGTAAEYDAITTKDPNTFYIIVSN